MSKISKQSGIYQITNLVSGKTYIGSASRLDTRRNTHWCQLRGGYHFNSHLQNSWNKHKEEAFQFSILLLCSKQDLVLYEQICIDRLSPDYNISPTAKNCTGRRLSEDTKRRISLAKKGVPHNNKRVGVIFSEERKRNCARSGEQHGRSLLSEAQVLEIYKLAIEGSISQCSIGTLYSVSASCVCDIKRGKSWKHLGLTMDTGTNKSETRVGGKV